MDIPNGFGQWTAIFSQVGNAREMAVTCGYANAGGAAPSVVLNNLEVAGEDGVLAPFDPGSFSSSTTLQRLYCIQRRANVLESDVRVVGTTGSNTGACISINNCLVVAKQSAQAGRQYRGRFGWPGTYVLEADVNERAEIDSTVVGNLQDSFTHFLAELLNQGLFPVLLHSQPKDPLAPIPIPTAITAFDVRTQLGGSRRRIKRFSA